MILILYPHNHTRASSNPDGKRVERASEADQRITAIQKHWCTLRVSKEQNPGPILAKTVRPGTNWRGGTIQRQLGTIDEAGIPSSNHMERFFRLILSDKL